MSPRARNSTADEPAICRNVHGVRASASRMARSFACGARSRRRWGCAGEERLAHEARLAPLFADGASCTRVRNATSLRVECTARARRHGRRAARHDRRAVRPSQISRTRPHAAPASVRSDLRATEGRAPEHREADGPLDATTSRSTQRGLLGGTGPSSQPAPTPARVRVTAHAGAAGRAGQGGPCLARFGRHRPRAVRRGGAPRTTGGRDGPGGRLGYPSTAAPGRRARSGRFVVGPLGSDGA
jgi:hypothetical protein